MHCVIRGPFAQYSPSFLSSCTRKATIFGKQSMNQNFYSTARGTEICKQQARIKLQRQQLPCPGGVWRQGCMTSVLFSCGSGWAAGAAWYQKPAQSGGKKLFRLFHLEKKILLWSALKIKILVHAALFLAGYSQNRAPVFTRWRNWGAERQNELDKGHWWSN